MSKLAQPLNPKILHRFGRFGFVRRAYSFLKGHQQRLNRLSDNQKRLQIAERSIFDELKFDQLQIDNITKQLYRDGISFGLYLSLTKVQEIYQYASSQLCIEPGFEGDFLIGEVENGRLRGGRQVTRALVQNVMHCNAVKQLVHDPLLLNIVQAYLRYYPSRISQHLTWSVASDLSESEKRKLYPPTTYHYDIAGFNFMTAYFYITDVDEFSGPHVMIKGSHHRKPVQFLLSSGRHSDETVLGYYGQEPELMIKGEKGFGFMQDPSCFHKVISPVKKNRLLLQIRYA